MEMSSRPKSRVYYIDNLRIFLISLVVLHHLAITYGGPGSWFYNESSAQKLPELLLYSMFLATNQAFFMGMFFFISAYFLIPSTSKKGVNRFSKDRLLRLGIPLLIFYFILFPLTVYIRDRLIYHHPISLSQYIFQDKVWGFGPMWFIEALLIFTFVYVLWSKFTVKGSRSQRLRLFPGPIKIITLAVLIGIVQFLIRIWLPVGWAMTFTDFQFPHFIQYIILFMLGIVAYRNQWLDQITYKSCRNWFIGVQVFILILLPLIFFIGGGEDIDKFMGGLHWQSAVYAIWEQIVGFGMIIGLLGIFKHTFNDQSRIGKLLSSAAYAVFVFHTPLLLLISSIFVGLQVPQIWKFIILAPISLIVCFVIASLIKQIPLVKKIF